MGLFTATEANGATIPSIDWFLSILTMWIQLAGSVVHPVKDLRMWRAHPLLRLVGIPRS